MCRFQRQWADVKALTCSRSLWTRHVERDDTKVIEVGEWGRFQSAPFSPLFPLYMRRIKADVVVVHVPNPTAELGFRVTEFSSHTSTSLSLLVTLENNLSFVLRQPTKTILESVQAAVILRVAYILIRQLTNKFIREPVAVASLRT